MRGHLVTRHGALVLRGRGTGALTRRSCGPGSDRPRIRVHLFPGLRPRFLRLAVALPPACGRATPHATPPMAPSGASQHARWRHRAGSDPASKAVQEPGVPPGLSGARRVEHPVEGAIDPVKTQRIMRRLGWVGRAQRSGTGPLGLVGRERQERLQALRPAAPGSRYVGAFGPATTGTLAPSVRLVASDGWRQRVSQADVTPELSGARARTGVAAWPIPSPSSRRPDQRAGRDGSSGDDLPPLEAAREVCSADGPDDGERGKSQAHGSSIPPGAGSAPAGGTFLRRLGLEWRVGRSAWWARSAWRAWWSLGGRGGLLGGVGWLVSAWWGVLGGAWGAGWGGGDATPALGGCDSSRRDLGSPQSQRPDTTRALWEQGVC